MTLRTLTDDQLHALTDDQLRARVNLAFEHMARYQRGSSRGAQRARNIRNEAWAEMDRRGIPRAVVLSGGASFLANERATT